MFSFVYLDTKHKGILCLRLSVCFLTIIWDNNADYVNILCTVAQCYRHKWFALNLFYLRKCEGKMHLKEWVLYSSKFCGRRTENLMLLEGSCAKQVTQQPNVFLILFCWGLSIAVFLGEDKIRHYSLTQKRKLKALGSVLTVATD